MKTLTLTKKLALLATLLMGNATTAWAADVAREDNSDLFVWIFLGFCALIIVAQLIPAAMMVLGIARGVKKNAPQPVAVAADQQTTREG